MAKILPLSHLKTPYCFKSNVRDVPPSSMVRCRTSSPISIIALIDCSEPLVVMKAQGIPSIARKISNGKSVGNLEIVFKTSLLILLSEHFLCLIKFSGINVNYFYFNLKKQFLDSHLCSLPISAHTQSVIFKILAF